MFGPETSNGRERCRPDGAEGGGADRAAAANAPGGCPHAGGAPGTASPRLGAAGAVRAADRLVVPDASVFSALLGVNPQVTTMAFATRAARRMADEW